MAGANMARRIAMIHPDLGIGGAEQMVVNIALALKASGHFVKIFTPYHDPKHCFPETVDGTLEVEVVGNLWPSSIRGRFLALCAYVRMLLASLFVVMYAGKYDYVIVDQVSAVLPVLRLSRVKILFYCHFPDKLLCVDRKSGAKQMYRRVLDSLEEWGLRYSDVIMVNSNFTKKVVSDAFSSSCFPSLEVVYPCISPPEDKSRSPPAFLSGRPYFMSLNRYERKKDIEFSLKSFAELRLGSLLIAGGYDSRLEENVNYLKELKAICHDYKLTWADVEDWSQPQAVADVYFAVNLNSDQRDSALTYAISVLYTPENEHFGMIPLEAMVRGTPVIAAQSGGPLETIKHTKTGYLLPKTPTTWSEQMRHLYEEPNTRNALGEAGRQQVLEEFTLSSLRRKLSTYIN